jgi:uncharacterized damage-inducible protein DinB
VRYQDQVVRLTQKAVEDVCRAACALPEDRIHWSPGGEARSALSQMQEIAVSANWFVPILRERRMPEFNEHALREARNSMAANDTLEKCVEAARASTSELCHAAAAFPDEELEREMTLPFGGGMVATMADILLMHYWNAVYHLGQINQIQLMLGDREMH